MNNILIESWRHCDWAGKANIVLLGLISLYSWAIMIEKFSLFRRVNKANSLFLKNFSEGKISECRYSLWSNVFSRLVKDKQKINLTSEKLTNLLRKFSREEFFPLENRLDFLLLAAGVGPFMGLLGTVWGLLLSFHSMGQTGVSSISVVASGVAEALISTVIGLLVAIPAAAGHNFFSEKLRIMQKEGEDVLESFYIFLR